MNERKGVTRVLKRSMSEVTKKSVNIPPIKRNYVNHVPISIHVGHQLVVSPCAEGIINASLSQWLSLIKDSEHSH